MPTVSANKRFAEGHDVEKTDLGETIKHLRQQAALSQSTLAERLGVPQSSISQWERGESSPLATVIPELAAALGVGVEELFKPTRKRPKK